MKAEQLLQHFERISEAPDAIKRLRRFILDLAVRGKLVEQDPSEEPAKELLKQIAAEKARLVKAGEIKAVKPYERRDSSNLKLPDGWLMVSLAEIVNRHLGGGTPSKSNLKYWDGPLLWASVKDVGKSKYLTTTIDRISVEGLENSSSNLITPGNLLVVTRMGLGKVSINTVPVAINQDLRALFMSSLMDIDYCYNFFLTHGFEGSGLTVKGIKIEELLSISFPLPPLTEQHRIVAKVDELMSLCDQLEAAKAEREKCRDSLVAASLQVLNQPAEEEETLREHARFTFNNLLRITTRATHIKQLRQTILNLAVRGKLVEQDPSDEPAINFLNRIAAEKVRPRTITKAIKGNVFMVPEETPFSIPASWEWAYFADYALDISTGPFGSALHQSDYVLNGIPLVNPSHMINDKIRPDPKVSVSNKTAERLEGYRMKEGDIVMARRGEVGRAALVTKKEVGWLCGTGSFFVSFTKEVPRDHILLLLRSELVRSYLSGKAIGTTMTNLNHGILKNMPLPIPPLAEQHRIAAKVDELMAICDQLEAQITATEQDNRRFLESVLADALAPGIDLSAEVQVA